MEIDRLSLYLLYYLFSFSSPFLWETMQNDPQGSCVIKPQHNWSTVILSLQLIQEGQLSVAFFFSIQKYWYFSSFSTETYIVGNH